MTEWTKVASPDDIPRGTSKLFQISEHCVALFHTDEGFFAVQDLCPHRAGPLSEGKVRGTEVQCPWHAARFNLKDGAVLSGPTKTGLVIFPVRIEEQSLWIGLEQK